MDSKPETATAREAATSSDMHWLADRIEDLCKHISVGKNESRLALLIHHAQVEILAALRAPAAVPPAPGVAQRLAEHSAIADRVCREVCELPDRSAGTEDAVARVIAQIRSWFAWRELRRAADEFLDARMRSASLTNLGITLAEAMTKDPARKAHLGEQLRMWTWIYYWRRHQRDRLNARRVPPLKARAHMTARSNSAALAAGGGGR